MLFNDNRKPSPNAESKQSYLFAEPIRQLSDNQKSRGRKRAKKR